MTGVLLVHGGAATGGTWDRLVPLLAPPVLAPDLPGRGAHPVDLGAVTLAGGAASVAADVAASPLADETDLVLVAHSSGGLFVPAIAEAIGVERVKALVLYAASVPPEGGLGLDCMQERHRESVGKFLEAAQAEGRTITTPLPTADAMRTSSGEDLTDEQTDFVADPSRLVEDSFMVYTEPVRYSIVAGVPTTYVVSLRDRAVPPALQREMAGRLPAEPTVVEIDTGHLAFVTQPEVLAGMIEPLR